MFIGRIVGLCFTMVIAACGSDTLTAVAPPLRQAGDSDVTQLDGDSNPPGDSGESPTGDTDTPQPGDAAEPPECRVEVGPELRVAAAALPLEVIWDDQAFMVVVEGGGAVWGRRVQRDGTIVDPPGGVAFDARTKDLGFAAGRYAVVTSEPALDDIYSPLHCPGDAAAGESFAVAYYEASRDGTPLGPKTLAICNAPNGASQPRVAVTPHGMAIVASTTFQAVGQIVSRNAAGGFSGAGNSVWPFGRMPGNLNGNLLSIPNVVGYPGGFAIVSLDRYHWTGCADAECATSNCAEYWGALFNLSGRPVSTWRQITNVPLSTPACPLANVIPSLGFGTSRFLMVGGNYTEFGDPVAGMVRVTPLDSDFTPRTPTVVPEGVIAPYDPAPLGFDGASFVTIPNSHSVRSLRAYRFREDGVQLDPDGFELTPDDGIVRSLPKLASDRAGRHLVAYLRSGDVYARLFTTCP